MIASSEGEIANVEIIYTPANGIQRYRERSLSDIDTIVIHRIGKEIPGYPTPNNAKDLERIFSDTQLGTGGLLPYSLLFVPETDILYQGLPLGRIGPHARVWNKRSLSIAILRDLDRYPLIDDERWSLLCFVGLFKRYLEESGAGSTESDVAILGHDECEGGRGDTTKRCPGRCLPMNYFRQDLDRIYGSFFHAEASLLSLGAYLGT